MAASSDSATSLLRSRAVLWIAAAVTVVLLLLVAYWLGWVGGLVPHWLAWGLVAVVLVTALVVGIPQALDWWRQRRLEESRIDTEVAGGGHSAAEFADKFSQALVALRALPQLASQDAVRALPWYVLLGPPGAGKTALLRGGNFFRPLTRPPDGPTQNCDWWVSNAAVVLDTTGRYVGAADADGDASEWKHLLSLLKKHRPREPINGVVIALPTDTLVVGSAEALAAGADRLRRRLEDLVKLIGVDAPVYVLVTKADLLEGFSDFFGGCSERITTEAVGYIDDPAPGSPRGAAALQRLAVALADIGERLHLFRLALLGGRSAEHRAGIFCFVEEFHALASKVVTACEAIFKEDVRFHTPLLRGVFLTSALQAGTPVSLIRRELHLSNGTTSPPPGVRRYFVRDLFDALLPRDRGLTALTYTEIAWRSLLKGLRIILAIGSIGVLAFWLNNAFARDREIVRKTQATLCDRSTTNGTAGAALAAVDRCRLEVERLAADNRAHPSWRTLGFGRSHRLATALRDGYVDKFAHEVLEPLDARLDQAFVKNPDPLPLVLLVARRVALGRHSLTGPPTPQTVAEQSIDYPLMLSPVSSPPADAAATAQLERTHLAFMQWQRPPKDALSKAVEADRTRLHRWLTANHFDPERVLQFVNKRSPPLTLEEYWELPPPIATVAAARVDAACTKRVWDQDIAPFLQEIQDATPETAPELRAFRERYLVTCFSQWKRFLTAFPQGADRWSGPDRRRTLALRVLTPQSPYLRAITDANASIGPWIPESAAQPLAPD